MQLGTDPHPATAPLTAGQLIVGFRFTGFLRAGYHTFQGAASPYGEIISGAEFRHLPGVAALGADLQAESAAESVAEVSAEESLFAEDKLQTVKISPRETAQARLSGVSLLID